MTTKDVKKLKAAFEHEFQSSTVEYEKVGANGRYRFAIIAPAFKKLSPLKRQDAVWKIVDQTLERETAIDISLIFTYAPGEIDQAA